MLLWPSRSHTAPAAWEACHLQVRCSKLMVKTSTSATLQFPQHRFSEATYICRRSTPATEAAIPGPGMHKRLCKADFAMICLTSGSQGFVACPRVTSEPPDDLHHKSRLLCQEDWASLAVFIEPFLHTAGNYTYLKLS